MSGKERKQKKSQPLQPLTDIKSARAKVGGVYRLYSQPGRRVTALTKLFKRAFAAEKPNVKAIRLVGRAREREVERFYRENKASRIFVFGEDYKGKFVRELHERIWASLKAARLQNVVVHILALKAFARKHNCREYVAEYLVKGLAMKMKGFVFSDDYGKTDQYKGALFRALRTAIELYREAGKEAEAKRVERFTKRLFKAL